MSSHSLIVSTNSIVTAASKAVTFQRRATRLNASVPPLRCCHPARASRATPQQKTIVFASGASISFRRRAQSDLACAASSRFTSLPCPLSRFPFFHVLVSRHLFVYGFYTLPRHQLEGSRFPAGTLGIQTASLRASLAQAFAHNVSSPPTHPFWGRHPFENQYIKQCFYFL